MSYLKEYLENLLEEKPIGDKNKEIWLDYLKEKYSKNYEGLFVSFVSEDKIGINPKSIHQTPNGVYTYPMKFLLDDNKVPFRGTTKPKKIKILKAVSGNVLDSKLSKEVYHECLKKLNPRILDVISKYTGVKKDGINTPEKFISISDDQAKSSLYFGRLWNLTRLISKTPNEWTKILIDLGFDWANDNGKGIIHENEPTQAVFLNPKSYKLIDEEFVDTEERYVDKNKTLEFKNIKSQLDINKDRAMNFLTTEHQKIIKTISRTFETKFDFIQLLFKTIFREKFDFTEDEQHKILKIYTDLIVDTLKDDKMIDVNLFHGMFPVEIKIVTEFFYKQFYDLLYKQILLMDKTLLDSITPRIAVVQFPDVFMKLIKEKKTDVLNVIDDIDAIKFLYELDKKVFQNIYKDNPYKVPNKMVNMIKHDLNKNLKESFKISSENVDDYYDTFKKSYDSSTGHSWSKEKFIQRSSDWIFFGDSSGFITVRKQKSGFYKITGSAGSPKSILKGLDELISENKPTWTAATESIADMLKKKGFFVAKGILYYPFIKLLIESIPSYVFGDSIEQVKTNGAVVFNVDGHSHEKFFCCNKIYLKELLNSSQTPDKLKQIISKIL